MKVTFDFFAYNGTATWGSTGDGLSFFLVDGTANPTVPGTAGSGLGYTNLVGGYIGVGFDEFGSFAGASTADDSVAIRGSTATGNTLLKSVSVLAQGGIDSVTVATRNAALRRAQIILTPTDAGIPNQLSVAMDFNLDGDFADVGEIIIAPFDITTSNGAVPTTFKFGFSGSTGAATNIHEIRNLIYETVNLPTATDKTVNIDEDTTYTFTLADFGFSDLDPSDSLQNVRVTQIPSVGSLQLSGNNTTTNTVVTATDITNGNLKFVPVVNGNGISYSNFKFQVSDGTGYSSASNTITFDVNSINDAPTAVSENTSGFVNNPVTTNIRTNDTDPDTGFE